MLILFWIKKINTLSYISCWRFYLLTNDIEITISLIHLLNMCNIIFLIESTWYNRIMLEQYTIKETLNRFLQVCYFIYNEDKASYLLYMYFVGLLESKVWTRLSCNVTTTCGGLELGLYPRESRWTGAVTGLASPDISVFMWSPPRINSWPD